jgi:hypothetical protein
MGDQIRQAEVMRRHRVRVPALRLSFAGFRLTLAHDSHRTGVTLVLFAR